MSAVPPIVPPPVAPTQPIPNHLAWSITMTVLCFLICCTCYAIPGIVTGIVAIVFSSKVNALLNQGDIAGATRASGNAKVWAWVTTGIFILAIVVSAISFATLGVDGFKAQYEEFQRQIEASR